MNFTLYLVGYGNQIPETFFERLEAYSQKWVVLDIRARRTSWCYGYRHDRLELALKRRGHDYLWLYELGAHNGGLVNECQGLQALEAQMQRAAGRYQVALLCAERSSTNCHRRLVAERLQERLARRGHSLEIRFI